MNAPTTSNAEMAAMVKKLQAIRSSSPSSKANTSPLRATAIRRPVKRAGRIIPVQVTASGRRLSQSGSRRMQLAGGSRKRQAKRRLIDDADHAYSGSVSKRPRMAPQFS